MAVTVTSHKEGSVLPVRAQPAARKNAVTGERNGMLKVAVTAPPEEGKANLAITELLREWLGVKRSQVELLSGATSREKRFLVRGVTAEELAAKVATLLGG